jgi:3-oxoacyl-[acyl-carrier protein] reductase
VTNRAPLFPPGAAFVVGGSGGIGSAICAAFAQAGSDVVLTFNRNEEAADAAAEAVRGLGRKATVLQLSLEDSVAVKAALEHALREHAEIHTVVYAAGPYVPMKFLSQISPEEMKDFLLSDTSSCFNLLHAALPPLRRSRGSIVAITTTVLSRWAPQEGLSAVPKAGIDRLITGIAREEGRFGVRANSVALGLINAGMFQRVVASGAIDEQYMNAMSANVPLRRLGTAEEVADATIFLASARSAYTTGVVLRVDGGFAT